MKSDRVLYVEAWQVSLKSDWSVAFLFSLGLGSVLGPENQGFANSRMLTLQVEWFRIPKVGNVSLEQTYTVGAG